MALINKTNIVPGNIIQAQDVLNIIEGLDGTSTTTTVIATGSFKGTFDGSLSGSLQGTASWAVTASYAFTVATSAAGAQDEIQFNNGGLLSTDASFKYNSTIHSFEHGTNTTADGSYAHTEGNATVASGVYSHAEGTSTAAGLKGWYTDSINNGIIVFDMAYGDITSEFGTEIVLDDVDLSAVYGIKIFGIASTAWDGTNTTVTLYDTSVNTPEAYIGSIGHINPAQADSPVGGASAHAEGINSIAIGEGSHAEGYSTKAFGQYSHAEGNATVASGVYSHAEGRINQAIGDYSHAEGFDTKTIGSYSHAEGEGTIASGSAQHVSGMYNMHDNPNALFTIGDGTNDLNRHDVVNVYVGEVQITGSLSAPTITGSLYGTSSWSVNTTNSSTASLAVTASYALSASVAISASYALTASYAVNAVTASYALTASYIDTAISNSFSGTSDNTTATYTVTFTQTNGGALPNKRIALHYWIATSSYAGPSGSQYNSWDNKPTLTVASGSVLSTPNTGSLNHAMTDSNGLFVLNVTATGNTITTASIFLHVEAVGTVTTFSQSLYTIVFAP